MSKRFGRNQKRRLRAALAEAQLEAANARTAAKAARFAHAPGTNNLWDHPYVRHLLADMVDRMVDQFSRDIAPGLERAIYETPPRVYADRDQSRMCSVITLTVPEAKLRVIVPDTALRDFTQ